VANRNSYTPDPHKKSMEELLAEEREAKLRKAFIYDDSNDEEIITINLFLQTTPVFSPVEPEDSLKMGDEHLNIIPATESDEFNKSSAENLVPIPSESGEISNSDYEFVENNRLDNHVDTNDIPFDDNHFESDEDEIDSDSHNEYKMSDKDSCGDIDDVEESLSDYEFVSLDEIKDWTLMMMRSKMIYFVKNYQISIFLFQRSKL
jgi:hypothetical protein